MRNAIVFINICIVAAVTMLLMEFEATSSVPTSDAVGAVSSPSETDLQANVSSGGTTLAALKRIYPASSRAALSEKETVFVRTFIAEMSEARKTSLAQAAMAAQRGTSRPLKDYGAWMMISQQQMLQDLTKLAELHHIPLTESVEVTGDEKANTTDGLTALQELHGRKFDARYIKLMAATYKRDLKMLERAGYSTDPEVQVFAARYLSITRDNYIKLQNLR